MKEALPLIEAKVEHKIVKSALDTATRALERAKKRLEHRTAGVEEGVQKQLEEAELREERLQHDLDTARHDLDMARTEDKKNQRMYARPIQQLRRKLAEAADIATTQDGMLSQYKELAGYYERLRLH